jgi:hypothetical protein
MTHLYDETDLNNLYYNFANWHNSENFHLKDSKYSKMYKAIIHL